jgi:hypothetical protein
MCLCLCVFLIQNLLGHAMDTALLHIHILGRGLVDGDMLV